MTDCTHRLNRGTSELVFLLLRAKSSFAQQNTMVQGSCAHMTVKIDRQLPVGEEIFLDHVGHFVIDPDAASEALLRAGFAVTPRSVQVNPDGEGGVRLTGTGNVTSMFRRGYIEILFKPADTALGREFNVALTRY